METIKSYTDLEQSKVLAKILPLESADMKWFSWKNEIDAPKIATFGYSKIIAESYKDTKAIYLPCWSLAALLSVLPKNLNIGRPSLESNYKGYYWIQYYDEFMKPNNYKTECFNNSIDACFEMILKLEENNLL